MAQIEKIPVMYIHTSPMNPRKTFDEEKLEELAQNIEEQGLLQPITVRKISDEETHIDEETGDVVSVEPRYEIVCGERRFRAWNMLAKKSDKYNEIPCIVREMTDEQAFEAMITENLQRQDVDPVEEALAFSLLAENGKSVDDIAAKFGKSNRFVLDRIKLNGLIPELKVLIKSDDLPLSGAIILSKLGEKDQKGYYDSYPNGSSVNEIKRFIDNKFGIITSCQFIDEDGFSSLYPKCADCGNNTANYSCLFYEMKGKEQKCTNPECLSKKEIDYIFYKIMQESGNLVKEGDSLDFGKSVIIFNSPEPYWNDELKRKNNEFLQRIRDAGFAVVEPHEVFDTECFYKEDDERVARMLSDNKIYRCISFNNGYGKLYYSVKFYYVKKHTATSTCAVVDVKSAEIDKIKLQMQRNKEIAVENAAKTMREWAQSKKSYPSKSSELSLNEKLVFDVMILRGCSSDYLDSIGINKYDTKDKSWIDYVKNNQSERMHWYREFIRENLTSNDVNFYDYMRRCQIMIFSEQYPDEFSKMNKKILDSYSKKESSLKSKLDELEKA
jgi:ParB/RepB/Spo0J family partition protein